MIINTCWNFENIIFNKENSYFRNLLYYNIFDNKFNNESNERLFLDTI